jgi:tRNA (cmo5U34)-methyltransferase
LKNWTEDDSATYAAIAEIAVPRRREMMATLVAAIPFGAGDSFRMVELGSGEGRLAEALLDTFPAATILALDGSESMRQESSAKLARFGARAAVRDFTLDGLDWWDLMKGVGVVVSSLCLHHLNDAKKQYLYKAAAERVSSPGALLVADLVEPMSSAARDIAADAWDEAARDQAAAIGRPDLYQRFVDAGWNHFRTPDAADHPSALLHHLVWLRQAGFAAVDCVWQFAGHAVFGGCRPRQTSR